MRGKQLWSCLFEMEMYLRLRLACPGASVTTHKKVCGKGACGKNVDLEIDGCYAEIYSPRDGEILVPNHWVTTGDTGKGVFRRVLSKDQLGAVGSHETVLIVECPPSVYMSVACPSKAAMSLLAQSKQPGAVFFVSGTRSARRQYALIKNPGAKTPAPESIVGALRGALELEFPPAGSQ